MIAVVIVIAVGRRVSAGIFQQPPVSNRICGNVYK
jgi:hypothetical protein